MIVSSVLAASALAIGGYWLGHARGTRGGGERAAAESPVPEPQIRADEGNANAAGTVDRLERRLAALEAREVLAKAAQSQAASPAASAQPERYDPAKEEERRLERAAAIEAVVKTEPRDKDWASPTESQLQAAVSAAVAAGAKFSIRTLRCATTVCDMVLTASSAEDLGHIAEDLGNRITGMNSMDMSPPSSGPDGRTTVTCRLFRQGYPRPDEGLM
jgi:hypothetical protein